MRSAFGVEHGEHGEICKYYMEQRRATQSEMASHRAKHRVKSKLMPGRYKQGWAFADDNGQRGIDLGREKPNIGPTKEVKRFSRHVGGETI